MKTPVRSSLVLLALSAACAKTSPSDKSVASSSPPRSAERSAEFHNEKTEPLTPASRTRDPSEARPANPTWGSDPEDPTSTGMPTPAGDTPTTARDAAPTGDQAARTPDVIYVPTPQPIVDRMLELAQVKKDDVVYDLGCGDGRIVVTAAKKYGAKAIGFDIDPKRITEARANVRKNKVEDLVTIEQKDIFTIDLTPASVVTLYLLPSLNDRLVPQLERLSPGARIVSHDYAISGVTPVQHLSLQVPGDDRDHEVYFWTAPLKRKAALPQPIVPGPRVSR
ncbi:MAG TPA: methyltransferase domain-containing protein [Polyangiaceae bacterium]